MSSKIILYAFSKKLKLLWFSIALNPFFSCSSFAQDNPDIPNVEFVRCYDADTCRFNIKGYPDLIGKDIPIRVNGIDAPEIRGKCQKEKDLAIRARDFTISFLRSGSNIELRKPQRGKYFRIVADVYVDGVNLADRLLEANLAIVYTGNKKNKDWCE
jgi:endonuclease YncB( thermonuclease family)